MDVIDVEIETEQVTKGAASARERVMNRAATLDDAELEAGLRSTEAVRRVADALELTLIAEVNKRGEERGLDGLYRDLRLPEGEVAEMAPDAVALAVGLGPYEARPSDRPTEISCRALSEGGGWVRPWTSRA